MEIIELWPFSQGEIDHSPDAFIDAAFSHGRGPRLVAGYLLYTGQQILASTS